MFRAGEGAVFNFLHSAGDRVLDVARIRHKIFNEFGFFAGRDVQHIVNHQNLPARLRPRANADGDDLGLPRDFGGERRGHGFQNH